MKRSCLIYGSDGFDADVLLNLRAFYRLLGYSVFHSRRLYPSDLLVLQRPPNRNLSFDSYHAIHIFDYVGTPLNDLLTGILDDARVVIFCSSRARTESTLAAHPCLEGRVVTLPPPVIPSLWELRPQEPDLRIVHVGNYKPFYSDDSDAFAVRFLSTLQRELVQVWGHQWPNGIGIQHGPVGISRVSSLYSRARWALGMMYPWQRATTFSGRFWHAPLNGCALISEPGTCVAAVPGVMETDYSEASIEDLLRRGPGDPRAIREAAHRYWSHKCLKSIETVTTLAPQGQSSIPFQAGSFRRVSVRRIENRAQLTARRLLRH